MPGAPKPSLTGLSLARAVWRLARLYWGSAEERGVALLLLAGTLGLELATVCGSVLISVAERRIFDALGDRQGGEFLVATALFLATLLGFVLASTFRIYVRQALEIRWRRALTAHFVERWMGPHAYWQAELHPGEVDNPDQRISEDVRDFVASGLGLPLSLVSALATLVSFGGVLWAEGSHFPLSVAGWDLRVPGLMLWVALAYAALSSWITHLSGRRLVPINFDRLRFEADFRYGLVRFRDNVEPVLLSQGEELERRGAHDRFQRVIRNWWQLIRAQRNLTLLTSGVSQANGVIPILVAAPAYFAGHLTLGGIAQTRIAYGQVSGALTWFVNAYQEIARWRANVERLSSLADVMEATAQEFGRGGIRILPAPGPALRLADLQLSCPDGRVLVEPTSATLSPGEHVAIAGPSGAGKTALLRTFAGIWPFGAGRIEVPAEAKMLFLSQRPYIPDGSLRAVLSYPAPEGTFSDERIAESLRLLGLDRLAGRLDEVDSWEQQLSDHERQRLAIVRVLLNEPDWIFLDRATSALDEATETRVYELLEERLPRSSVISVAYRPSVDEHHARRWTLSPGAQGASVLQAA